MAINSVKNNQSVGNRQRVKIFTVDPPSRTIHATLMREGAGIQIAVWETGPLFRWPLEGEIWTIFKGTNGIWMLDKLMETVDTDFSVESMNPGETKISSTTILDENGWAVITIDASTLVANDTIRWDGDSWVRASMVVPQARVFNNANISVVNNTTQIVTFNSSHYDSASSHSNSVNPSRLTAPLDGLYQIGCNVSFANNVTGTRQAELLLQGGIVIAADQRVAVTGTRITKISLNTQTRLFAGWYVEVRVFQDSGGALNLNFTDQHSPEFYWSRISP